MKIITPENIKTAYRIYDQLPSWKASRDTITLFFKEHLCNTELSSVLIKVVLIDSLYGTNLKIPVAMTRHILSINSLDEEIRKGSLEAIEKIRRGTGKDTLSFASKYCHFHHKDKYPLYDRYVGIALSKLCGWKISRVYEDFFKIMNKLRMDAECKDFEELDMFMWLYGQREELRKGKTETGKEVRELYLKEKDFFDSLG